MAKALRDSSWSTRPSRLRSRPARFRASISTSAAAKAANWAAACSGSEGRARKSLPSKPAGAERREPSAAAPVARTRGCAAGMPAETVGRRHGVVEGDYDFLEKPFSTDRLAAKIRAARGPRAASE